VNKGLKCHFNHENYERLSIGSRGLLLRSFNIRSACGLCSAIVFKVVHQRSQQPEKAADPISCTRMYVRMLRPSGYDRKAVGGVFQPMVGSASWISSKYADDAEIKKKKKREKGGPPGNKKSLFFFFWWRC